MASKERREKSISGSEKASKNNEAADGSINGISGGRWRQWQQRHAAAISVAADNEAAAKAASK
jgi:hypothetical protein